MFAGVSEKLAGSIFRRKTAGYKFFKKRQKTYPSLHGVTHQAILIFKEC
jgi:hypothetical protein